MAWLVPLVPLLAALLLAGVGRDGMDGEPPRGRLAVTAAAAMALTAGVAAFAAWAGWTGRLPWSESLGLSLDYAPATSPVAALFAVLVPVVAAPVLAYGAGHEEGRGLTRLLAVLAFFVAAMEVVAGAADLLTLLLGWELIGACSAVLIAHHWRDGENPRAGSIVFVTTRAGDLGLFLALGAAFAGVGSLEYGALGGLDGLHLHLVVAGVLVAAAAKSAQVPFAPWLFVAMKGPVTVSSLLHAATMVAAGAFLLIRLHTVLDTAPWFGAATMAVGLTTALMAGVVALLQSHAKRLLAGSTSAHYGLMFLAVGAGYPAVAALHLVAHALAKAPLFLATGIAHECAGSYELWRMELRRVLPGIATATLVVAGAIAGLPPLGAAWTKEAVVTTAGHAAPWVAVAAALAGALSAAYMARFFFQAFGTGSTARDGRSPRSLERWPLYLLAAATVALGVLWLPPSMAPPATCSTGRSHPSGHGRLRCRWGWSPWACSRGGRWPAAGRGSAGTWPRDRRTGSGCQPSPGRAWSDRAGSWLTRWLVWMTRRWMARSVGSVPESPPWPGPSLSSTTGSSMAVCG